MSFLLLVAAFPAAPAHAELFGSDYTLGPCPEDANLIRAGEFTGDDRQDVLATNGSEFWVIPGRRAGGFDAPILRLSGQSIGSLDVSDINGDGLDDIVALDGNRSPGVFLARRLGGFEEFAPFAGMASSRSMVLGDFNGDGRTDLALAPQDTNLVVIHTRSDDGGWATGISRPGIVDYPYLMSADWDGDGLDDVLWPAPWYDASELYSIRGGPDLAAVSTDRMPLPDDIDQDDRMRFADVNGDGHPELLATSSSDGLQALELRPDGSWVSVWSAVPNGEGYDLSIETIDVDGNGLEDLVAFQRYSSPLWVALSSFGTGLGDLSAQPFPTELMAVAAGNWLDDGPRLAFATRRGHLAILSRREEEMVQTTPLPTRTGLVGLFPATADLDHDGRLDLVLGQLETGEAGSIWLVMAEGGRTFRFHEYETGFPPEAVLAVDVTGDGHVDVVAFSTYRGAFRVYPGDGQGALGVGGPIVHGPFGMRTHLAQAGDYDADGDIDIAVPGLGTEIQVFRNSGHGQFGAPEALALPGDVSGIVQAPLAPGSRPELLVLTYTPGEIHNIRLEAGGLVDVRVQESVSRSGLPSLADLDGDCRDDFILQVGFNDRIS
ncbi:MAG TPA: VCBS repeat-containing protein, partial [Candidatus Eisenbacteria bacterium]